MDKTRMHIGKARPAERAWIEAALEAERLCVLGTAPAELFAARDEAGAIVGAVGLERYGADGLLRSLVVSPAARGRGIGCALVAALEAHAAANGMATLYLLTETAADFFAALGYERIDRTLAPEPVAASEEFRDSCPETAPCFRKCLGAMAAEGTDGSSRMQS